MLVIAKENELVRLIFAQLEYNGFCPAATSSHDALLDEL